MGTITPWLKLYRPDATELVSVTADLNNNFNSLDILGQLQVNVRAYGATGDGVTDDYGAIQSLLDSAGGWASTYGGCIVIIPPGKYALSARLNVYSDMTIVAYGAYLFRNGTPTSGLLCNFKGTDSFSGYAGNSRIRIYGGIWDAKAQNAAADAAYDTIDFNHCRDILVRDVVIRNTCSDHALEFNSTDGGQAINCRFEGFRDATTGLTRQFSEAVQIDVALSGSSTIGVFDGTHSKNILVQGCYAGPAVDGSGLGSFGKLAGSHTTASGGKYSNIRIIGNVVDGALDVGIGAYNWCDSVIANNNVYSTVNHGIRVTVPDPTVVGFSVLSTNVTVSGNTIDTTTGAGNTGIEIFGYTSTAGVSNCIVSGNVITGTAGTGIFANIVQDIAIIGNAITSSGSNGINVTASQYPLVVGNRIDSPATNYCIFFGQVTTPSTVSTTDGLIEGNLCLLNTGATAGIRLSTGTTLCLVTGNLLRKAGGAQTVAISCAGGVGTTNTVTQNDLTGFGSTATTITVSSGTVNKTIANDANTGTNLF